MGLTKFSKLFYTSVSPLHGISRDEPFHYHNLIKLFLGVGFQVEIKQITFNWHYI